MHIPACKLHSSSILRSDEKLVYHGGIEEDETGSEYPQTGKEQVRLILPSERLTDTGTHACINAQITFRVVAPLVSQHQRKEYFWTSH